MASIKIADIRLAEFEFAQLSNLELAHIVGGNSFEELNYLHPCGGVKVPRQIPGDGLVRIPPFTRSPYLIP